MPQINNLGFVLDGMAGPGSGTWTRITNLARGLTEYGVNVHLLAEASVHDAARFLDVASVTLRPRLSKFARFAHRQRTIDEFARLTNSRAVFLEAPPFIGSRQTPTFAAVHDLRHLDDALLPRFSSERIYQRHILPRFAPHLSGWLALSEYGKSQMSARLDIPLDKVLIVPPIVGAPSYLADLNVHSTTPYVLALGHIEARKNLATLITAARRSTWPSEVELWIAGEDHGELERLRYLSREISARVKFLGKVSEKQKWELMSNAFLVAIPSLLEGFGIVAVEAPISGTPVIVSDNSALSSLASHPMAAVPTLDPDAWSKRIAMLFEFPQFLSRILEAQSDNAKNFSIESVVPNLLNSINKILA